MVFPPSRAVVIYIKYMFLPVLWPKIHSHSLTLSKAQAKLHPQGLHSSHANLCRGQKNSIMLTNVPYGYGNHLDLVLSAVLQSSNLSLA